MPFHLHFSTAQVLWTLTFAALLVLLVVLLGRDRAKRFPFFTLAIGLVALRLLVTRLLYGRLQSLTMNTIMIVLGNLEVLVGLLVLAELARKAFAGAARRTWIVATAGLLVVAGGILAVWRPWIPLHALVANSRVAVLNLMLVVAAPADTLPVASGLAKGNLLLCMLTIELALLFVLFGRRYHAGSRSHAQEILMGLCTFAIAWLSIQGGWQFMAKSAHIQSREQYEHFLGIGDQLLNAQRTIYLCVLIWWIACMWFDEPGAVAPAASDPEHVDPIAVLDEEGGAQPAPGENS